jgi:hypothetical protein
MRGIASPASADLYFGKQFVGFFQQGYFQRRIHAGRIHRAEKTCGASAYDY